jgi:hypothetical protein
MFQISSKKATKHQYTAQEGQPARYIRQDARKMAGISMVPYTAIRDAYGNPILYTRKKDVLIHIIERPLYNAGDYERDPCSLILDQARRNAAAARKTRERSRKRQQARRTERPLEIEGMPVTTANVGEMLNAVKAQIKDAKLRGEQIGREYDKAMDLIDAELGTLEKQKVALNEFKRTFGKTAPTPQVYTAQNAATLAEQNTLVECDFI